MLERASGFVLEPSGKFISFVLRVEGGRHIDHAPSERSVLARLPLQADRHKPRERFDVGQIDIA